MSENHDPEQALQSSGSGAEDGGKGVGIALNVDVVESSSETAPDTVSDNGSVLQSSEESSGFVPPERNQGSALSPVVSLIEGAENSGQDDPDGTEVVVDAGKEDMFVDCPDELVGNADGREGISAAETEGSLMEETPSDMPDLQYEVEKVSLMHEVENTRATLNKAIFEKENVIHEFEEEREASVQELFSICRQLKTSINQQSLLNNITSNQLNESRHLHGVEDNAQVTNITLKDLVNECSQLVSRTLDERLQYEATIGELRNNLLMKDQEIGYLNAKVVEFSVSDEFVRSYAKSIEDSMKFSSEKERNMEVTLDKVLASLNSVLNQPDLLDDSLSEKTLHVERSTSHLIDNYNKVFLEINQIKKCLSGVESDTVFTEFGTILGSARDELIELKAKEVSDAEQIYKLEDENRRLANELDNYRLSFETVNAELEKAKSDLEQERLRCVNTKEKLTMAVTKGKALVQQREALKQSLAEKGLELEKYSIELQERSNALEAAELIKIDLAKERSNALEAAELIKIDLAKTENLVASLQENLLERNKVLESFKDIVSQLEVPRELKSMDSVDRLKWLVDEKRVLEAILLEFHKLKDTLNLSDFPDLVSPYDLKSSVTWLKESFFQAKDEIMILQDELAKTKEAAHGEIDRISAVLSIELQEKDYLQEELNELSRKHGEVMIKEHQTSLEKAQIIKMLQEESGMTTDDGGVSETSMDLNLLVYRCFQRIKEQVSAAAEVSGVYVESFEKVRSLLYVSHQDLMLHDILLEEESSNMSSCSARLRSVYQELIEAKEENVSLQKDIQRSEEKFGMLREKLSLAVKKGKGLVQDRENMKSVLDDKNIEIEKLKLQLDSLESTVTDCRNQINLLSIDTQRIPALESELGILKDQNNEHELFLLESNNMLQKVNESIDRIVLPINIVFEEPISKVKWIAEYIRESHDAKIRTEQELENVKEESSTTKSKLADALASMKSLEDALSSAEKNIFQLSEEKTKLESSKIHIEQELQKALDEAYSQSSKSAEASLSMNLLQESLSLAENKISVLVKEKEEAEQELQKALDEAYSQSSKSAEASLSMNLLQESLSLAENKISVLVKEKEEAEHELQKALDEAYSQSSKCAEASLSMNQLQESLSLAENKISVLVKEKEEAEVCKVTVEMESKKVKEEANAHTDKLAEAQRIITTLEKTLTELETNVALLTEQNVEAQSGIGKLEKERNILQEEVSSQASKLVEAAETRKSLEDALFKAESKVSFIEGESKNSENELFALNSKLSACMEELTELETNVALLTEQNVEAQSAIGKLETERNILQEEVSSQASKLVEAVETRKSLEDELFKAESKVSFIEGERKKSENELFALNSKLSACMEELAGTSGSLQSRSVEFASYLNDLHKFLADETLLTVVTRCFEKKLKSLREMDIILKNTRDCFVNNAMIDSHNHHAVKDPYVVESFSHGKLLDFAADNESGKVDLEDDVGNISSSFRKIMKGIWLKNKKFTDYFEGLSSSMDGFIADLLRKVEATREEVVFVCGHVESLKEMVKNLEMQKQEQVNTKVMLEDDVSLLLSACVDATKELQFEMTNHLLLLSSMLELDNLKDSIPMDSSETNGASYVESHEKSARSKSADTAEQLLSTSRKVRFMVKQFESASKVAAARIQEMQHVLEVTEAATEKVREEKDLNQNMIVKLETDLQLLENSCDDLRRQLEACQANEEKLKAKEAEVSSLYNSLLVKEQEAEDSVLSAMQMKALFEKVRRIELPLQESDYQDLEQYDSPDVKKLFYLIDYVSDLQNQLNLLSHDKQKLQSIITTQTLTIEQLKEEVDRGSRGQLDSEEMEKDLSEISYSLEQITSLLGSKYSGDSESDGLKGLVQTLGRQVLDMLSESENSKMKFEELSKKLIRSQKVVDELTAKNKLLEESLQGRTSEPEIIKERSIFEAPSCPSGSEISEIEDVGPVVKSGMPPVPSASAAHARTLRKVSSTDHLAINIETESDRLIGNGVEIDEDKGHVFKSLNSSGIIPRHGKLIADRVDGVWVSGGRILKSRPGTRLGVITYLFLIHIWLLGTIL